MAASRPTGTAKSGREADDVSVPTMALASPPPDSTAGLTGSSVKNSQFSAPTPWMSKYPRMTTSIAIVKATQPAQDAGHEHVGGLQPASKRSRGASG